MTGTTLSHYRIVSELGRGGMGIVYLGEDTKLDRQVAIKVLPPSALASEDDRARFYREAKAAAALNHPHIAQIFEIDEAVPSDAPHGTQPSPFIAMEYIDGEPLDDRIKRGPMKLAEAVRLATQIAGALGEAHEKGIVHRDVKASNVMLTSKGDAKVLDFGLALTAASTKLTRMGSTLGTVAYMSPEQARGEEVDNRTDLWALGVVLYEMVAGRNPFGGDYEQAVVYSILNAEPEPLTAVRTGVPMELERIVGKLLAKSADVRYQSAAGLLADLRALNLSSTIISRTGPMLAERVDHSSITSNRRVPLWALVAAFLGGAAVLGIVSSVLELEKTNTGIVHRLEMVLPTHEPVTDLEISADGSTLAYMGGTSGKDFIYIHDLSTGESRALEGTEGAEVVELSEDGSMILITTSIGVNRTSTRVSAAVTLFTTEEGTPRANWGPDDRIVYEDRERIYVMEERSGRRYPVVLADTIGVSDLDWPSVLPGGRVIMGTIEYAGAERALGFWDLETGEERGRIRQGGYRPQYVETGHVIMVVGGSTEPGTLVAMPIDIESLTQSGPLIPIATGVLAEQMSVSDTGTLVYRIGRNPGSFAEADLYIASVDARFEMLEVPRAVYNTIKLAPDANRAVISTISVESTARQGDALDTFILDLDTNALTPLTTGNRGGAADWWAGTDSVVHVNNTRRSQGDIRVVIRAADGSGSERELFGSTVGIHDIDVSRDGTRVAYAKGLSSLGATVIEVRELSTGEIYTISDDFVARRRRPVFSADGTEVLFQEESNLFIRSSDGTGIAARMSAGGQYPAWDHITGRTYGYGALSMDVWTGFKTTGQESISMPGRVTAMDVFPGGQSLLVAIAASDDLADSDGNTSVDSTRTINVVLNLFEELKR